MKRLTDTALCRESVGNKESAVTDMNEIKCPKCGSTNTACMDGYGAVSKYGKNVMLDIAPDMWLCSDCGESFRIDDADNSKNVDSE